MKYDAWGDKPYYSLNAYFKNRYGMKCYKIAVDAGCTCPNRDGTKDTRGCIFCSEGGSGDFAQKLDPEVDKKKLIRSKIEEFRARVNKDSGEKFVVYFQAYTNTYGDIDYLYELWDAAMSLEEVVGISIATRPDCLGTDVIEKIKSLRARYFDKFVWIEMGLQTIHDSTAKYIRRHFDLNMYDAACERLRASDIEYITHIILGLPGEDRANMLETVRYVCDDCRKPSGIKLQLLHVLKNTDLEKDYVDGRFTTLSKEEYLDILAECIQNIPEDVVLHRVTGDGPKKILISPVWSGNKKDVLNSLHKKLREENIFQGKMLI